MPFFIAFKAAKTRFQEITYVAFKPHGAEAAGLRQYFGWALRPHRHVRFCVPLVNHQSEETISLCRD